MCDKNSIFACFDAMITQKSHDHPGYRSWIHFSFDHDVAHAFWRHEDGSTCNRCACTRFKTPEQPSSVQSQQQAVKLMWRYKWISNWYVGTSPSEHSIYWRKYLNGRGNIRNIKLKSDQTFYHKCKIPWWLEFILPFQTYYNRSVCLRISKNFVTHYMFSNSN